jgi:cytochrome c553
MRFGIFRTENLSLTRALNGALVAGGLLFAPLVFSQTAAERFSSNCLACHGEGGKSVLPLTPSLAGQPSFYAITQLFLFREGRRANEAMTAVAKGMSDADLRAFSELIAKLPPPPSAKLLDVDQNRMQKGAALAKEHKCTSCHGSNLEGEKQVARLANQREDYLIQTLVDFKAGKRIGYTAAMNESLTGVSQEGLLDLAYYMANLSKP